MLITTLLACFGQSHADAMLLVCDAPVACEKCKNASPENFSYEIARYVDERLENDEVRGMLQQFANMNADARTKTLNDNAKRAGLSECKLANPPQN